ncbi:MAG: 6-phosphogluconolactonase [Sulfitobacter sp.]
MNFEHYADREMAAIDLANILAGELRECLLHHEFASFAVPGGTTPGPIFDALCAADLDWSRVHVMLTDERWVPAGHPRSNAGLIRDRLLVNRAAAAQFIPFYIDGVSVDAAATQLSQDLVGEMPISVLLLGMGPDMHTASLFPGAPGLDAALDAHAPLICAVHPEDQPEARITFSAQALDGAMSKHLVIFGDDKRAALDNASRLPAHLAPIGAVMTEARIHWAT